MYTTSARFRAALQGGHTVTTKIEVWSGNEFQEDITADIRDGNIVYDDVDVHTTGDVTFASERHAPADLRSLIAPNGNELRIWRGVRFPDGSDELVPMGVLGITDVRVDDSGDGFTMQVSLVDRSRKISRNKFSNDYVVDAGTNYIEAIERLLTSRWPSVEYSLSDVVGFATPQLVFGANDDPWVAVRKLAADIGCDFYFDRTGVAICHPVNTELGDPVWRYEEGPDCTLLYLNRQLKDEEGFNYCIVTGETTDVTDVVWAVAYDDDPMSPTYYLGPYGIVNDIYVSSGITNTSQAQAVANARLAKYRGSRETLQLLPTVNPALDTNDVVYVRRGKSNINNVYTVGKITTPLIYQRGQNVGLHERLVNVDSGMDHIA